MGNQKKNFFFLFFYLDFFSFFYSVLDVTHFGFWIIVCVLLY